MNILQCVSQLSCNQWIYSALRHPQVQHYLRDRFRAVGKKVAKNVFRVFLLPFKKKKYLNM